MMSKETVYYTIISFMGLSINMTGAYYVLFLRNIGLTFSQIALLNTVYMVMHVLIEYPSGVLADKYGRKVTFVLGMTLHAVYYTGVGLSRTLYPLALSYSIGGTGMAFISGTLVAWMVDEIKQEKGEDHIKFIFGKSPIFSGIFGALSGALASLVVVYGLHVPFLAAGGFGFLTVVFALVAMNENYGSVQKSYNIIFVSGIKKFFSEPELLLLTSLSILFNISIGIFMLTWQVILVNQGIPTRLVGVLFMVMFLAMSLGGIIASRLFKKLDKVSILRLVGFSAILCYLGMGILNMWWASLTCFVGIEIIIAIWGAAFYTWINEYIPSEVRATLLSAYSTIFAVSYAVTQPLLGKTIDILGKSSYFVGIGFFLICLLLIQVKGGSAGGK
ncbi:MAG: MFS transporter [Theionarchaea archaeon]|nr:MFS transporter [Theionarchaea archaeon]MBU7022489.1 MFS transporter [Theionarchaea archaeon]